MRSPSIAPTHDTVHLILCDFGKHGISYVETDAVSSANHVAQKILSGEFSKPIEVIAFNVDEGWSRNVSEDIAGLILEKARAEEPTLSREAVEFVEKHLDEEVEPELCA
jgi:hypothetical protein